MNSVNKKSIIEVDSKGVVVLFSEPINPKCIAILKNHGLMPIKESSCELTLRDLDPGTLVLTMTTKEKNLAIKKFPNYSEIYTIGEYIGQASEIEEPRSGELTEYGACYEYIDFAVKMAAEKLFNQ